MTERRPLPTREGWLAGPKTQLNFIRREQGVSQTDLAAITGISVRNLSRLENGEMSNPPLRYLVNCAKALGVDWQELVEPEWEEWEPNLQRRDDEPPLPERRAEPVRTVHRL